MSKTTYQLLTTLGMGEATLDRLMPLARMRTAAAGERLIAKGQHQANWMHVSSGLVGPCIADAAGSWIPLGLCGPGSWLGEGAFLDGRTAPTDWVCLSPVTALCISAAEALHAFETDPPFARQIAYLLQLRNAQQIEMLSQARNDNPQSRIILGLARLGALLNESVTHPRHPGPDSDLLLPLKQSVLASLCGVSRGVFNACLQHLAAAGWLQAHYGTLSLLSIQSWARLHSASQRAPMRMDRASMTEHLAWMDANRHGAPDANLEAVKPAPAAA